MLYKHVPDADQAALNQVYTWFATNDTRLATLKQALGKEFFRAVAAAYVCDELEKFEATLKIPARSGKALLPLIASVLTLYLKQTDARVCLNSET